MYNDVELDEFMNFGKLVVSSASLKEKGLVLTRSDGKTMTIGRYSASNRGIPGIDAEAAKVIAMVFNIKDHKSRETIKAMVETHDEATFTVASSSRQLVSVEISTKTTWQLLR